MNMTAHTRLAMMAMLTLASCLKKCKATTRMKEDRYTWLLNVEGRSLRSFMVRGAEPTGELSGRYLLLLLERPPDFITNKAQYARPRNIPTELHIQTGADLIDSPYSVHRAEFTIIEE